MSALSAGTIDVIAPADTADVLDALAKVDGATVRTGGDTTLQLQLQVAGGGAFDPATYAGDAATAAAVRTAFLLTVPRDAIVDDLVKPLWPEADGVDRASCPRWARTPGGAAAPDAAADIDKAKSVLAAAKVTRPVVVRVLTNTTDPLRTAMLEKITTSAAEAGFEVRPYTPVQAWAADLRGAPAGVGRRARAGAAGRPAGRLGGDALADEGRSPTSPAGPTRRPTPRSTPLAATLDPSAVPTALEPVATSLVTGGAVVSIVRQPVVVAQRPLPDGTALADDRAARARPRGPDVLVGLGAQVGGS